MANIINYFLEANTSKGFKDFSNENLKDKEIKYLKNIPQSTIQKAAVKIQEVFKDKNTNLEFIKNPLDNNLIGIINSDLNKGFICIQPYNLKEYFYNNETNLEGNKILNQKLDLVYNNLAQALKVHDEWEDIYLNNISFDKLNNYTDEIIEKLLKDNAGEESGNNINRFFGASTIYGPKDYILNLTDKLDKRYFIKGRPGTGKSTIMKKLTKAANKRKFNTFVYHCALDPDSLDMVIIPKLNLCIFDSTSPHEYFASRLTDETLDVYKKAVNKNTDEKFKEKLMLIENRYKYFTKKANVALNEVKSICDEIQNENLNDEISDIEILNFVI